MKILVVAATHGEASALTHRLGGGGIAQRLAAHRHAGHDLDILVTGVGMVATAAWCSRALTANRYDMALNFGVCGAFDPALALGTVVHVVSDRIAELGAEDGHRFLTLGELGLLEPEDLPFAREDLVNPEPPANQALAALPPVSGITVNTVHGHEPSIAVAIERFHPHVESMEGAAFMYACLIHNVRFAQVRAVSNLVERRDRARWQMVEAIQALGVAAFRIVEAA
jgi:futalosine hydrolase